MRGVKHLNKMLRVVAEALSALRRMRQGNFAVSCRLSEPNNEVLSKRKQKK